VLRIVYRLPDGILKKVLKRLRLYQPPLHRLIELSEGNIESLEARSIEYSGLLEDVQVNGTWKRTGRGRLEALDKWITSLISESILGAFTLLDVGGSDGVTTLDSVRYFEEQYKVKVKATILEMNMRLHCYRRGCFRYYVTHNGIPLLLQFGLLGLLFEETKAKEGIVFNPIIRVMKMWMQRHAFEKFFVDCGELHFVNPIVCNNPNINWLERDVLQYDPALVGQFDLIRCCNILNLGYFTESQLVEGIGILTHYLKSEGFLLVSRTTEDREGALHTASLWQKHDDELHHITDMNGGSEIKKLLLENV
jgi:hypothetical protein